MKAGRGYIVPVGGAEEKIGDVAILRRFAEMCGGGSCRIGVRSDRGAVRSTTSTSPRVMPRTRSFRTRLEVSVICAIIEPLAG